MKKLLIIILFLASVAQAQISPFAFGGSGVWALDFDGSTEYLSCTPALRLVTGEYSAVYPSITGDTSFACNQVYGSWSFTLNKTGADDVIDVYFINDLNVISGNSGYLLKYGADEKVYLYSVATGTPTAQITSARTYAIATAHTITITRNTNGAFNVLVNGTSIGTATNATYTNSNYSYIDVTGTCSITSLSFQQGEGSLDLNSYERIYHSNNRAFEDTTGFRWTGNGTHSIVRNMDGVTGSNLIPDSASTFNTGGTSYWSVSNGTASWESSDSSIKLVSNGGIGYISKSNLTAGASYKYSIKAKATTYTGQLRVFSGVPYPAGHTLSSSWQTFTGSFYATTAITYISLWTSHVGDIYFDNIVLEKLESRTGYSGKLISTASGDSTTNFISLPNASFDTLKTDSAGVYEKYTLEGWARGVGILGSPTYTSDFSAGVDGWTVNGGTVDGNIDGIDGQDNTLRFTSDNVATTHNILKTATTAGVSYKVTLSYYIPSTNTTIKKIGWNDGTTLVGSRYSTTDSWTSISITYLCTNTSARIYSYNSADIGNFTGTAGDVFYIKDVVVTPITQPTINIRIGNQLKSISGISCVPATFTKFVFNFQSNALVSNQDIKIWINQADTVYVDDVSLTKGWDMSVNYYINTTSTNTGAYWSYSQTGTSGNDGYTSYTSSNKARILFSDGYVSSFVNSVATTNDINTGSWFFANGRIKRGASTIQDSIYVSANATFTQDKAEIGCQVNNQGFYIGAMINATFKFTGKIGHIQIVKFTDISQSNVNSTTLTTAYSRGYLKLGEWTGGSPIEVGFWDWKGADITEILRDKSGTGNNLTGTNIDINDRVKVKGKFK